MAWCPVPIVMRAPICGGIGVEVWGRIEETRLEAWFVPRAGHQGGMPSTAADAKGLLKSAVRDDNPVLFLEHRLLTCRKDLFLMKNISFRLDRQKSNDQELT